jgi:hypothetical protein
MSEMKLIMERWRRLQLDEAVKDCESNDITVGDFIGGVLLASLDPESRKALDQVIKDHGEVKAVKLIEDNLEKYTNQKGRVSSLKTALGITAVVAGAAIAVGVVFPALPLFGAAALGYGGATAATGVAGATLTGLAAEQVSAVMIGREEKKLFSNKSVKALMGLFCIDMELLKLIENEIQAQFIKESDLRQEMENFFTANMSNPNIELPDLNWTLLDWINAKNLQRTKVAPK